MNTRGLYVLVGTVAAVAVLVTLLPFAVALRELPMARNSSTPWSEFGSYVGGVLGSVAALLNLVVVLFIATRLTELQQNQLATECLPQLGQGSRLWVKRVGQKLRREIDHLQKHQ